ncbi:hypothetical protein EUTSA_v10006885mg [Eutrema salsugineum]|uniref:Formin-like protein n=1 Tax=Eutrema salsugineum TaxID=72664 RepID=V4KSS5_EUTSA|nr:formin-like protein 4 [Eutrema salsugineum]ESQ34374.1 hypothetical protein EUTSA_v10006885mg [Eutrema salsugineum]
MAAMLKQPWPTFLLPLQLTLILILLFPYHSLSQSDSPRNIETFFPNVTGLSSPPAPPPSPTQNPPSSSSSDRQKITRAVLITAASTLLVAAVFFFFVHICARRRRQRRRDRVGVENTLPPVPPLAESALAREGFTRIGGNVKGLILDENGLDVLYWRKSQQSQRDNNNNKSGSFRKETVHHGDDEEKKNKKKSEPVTEIPLLRGRSSTSHSVIHNDTHRNLTTTHPTPPPGKSDSFEFAKPNPPPPIPVKQSEPAPPPPPPPTRPVNNGSSPPPPPPLKKTAALSSSASKPPPAPRGSSSGEGSSAGNGQVKLKPLHWDKVNPDSDHSMVWDKIDRGSFSFDGDLMEALFGYVAVGKKSPDHGGDNKKPTSTSPTQIFILDPRKSQNTAIVLKSLGISRDELVESLNEGNDFHPETLERLARIAPTNEEQSAILQFDGDTAKLADAESFLFHLLKAVPCAFTRLNALLFRANYYPEITHHNKSLKTLDSACTELRSRGLFVKLLEAILKSGNRMNAGTARGDAQAFNLTALLKLSDVKSVDGRTTLLNFVVEEVVRSEGKRCVVNRRSLNRTSSNSISEVISKEEQEKEYLRLGLPVVGGLSTEFTNVKKAASIDYETVSATCLALSSRAKNARRVLGQCGGEDGEGERFVKKMVEFLDSVEEEVKLAREEEKKVMELVKRTTEYYQAGAVKGKNPLHLFVIVKDFLAMVDKVCVEIARNLQRKTMVSPQEHRTAVKFPVLPSNFMSDRSKSDSGGSDSDT